MRKNNLFTMMMLCISMMFLWSCDEEKDDTSKSIIGAWQANESLGEDIYLIINFYDDGKVFYEAIKDGEVGHEINSGTYKYNNNVLELTDANCDVNPGRYSVSITGNMMKLDLLIDSCERSEIIPGTYTRK